MVEDMLHVGTREPHLTAKVKKAAKSVPAMSSQCACAPPHLCAVMKEALTPLV